MLTTVKSAKYISSLQSYFNRITVLGIIVINFSTLSANAQSRTADSFNFDEISVGDESNWNFSSENETVSIQDNLKELREYDISDRENFDVRLIRERRRRLGIKNWGNRGYRNYYSIENGIFPYYFPANRNYNYY